MSAEAKIRRGVRNARYAAIPNHVFEDSRLSMEARWLLSYLLSKPDNWIVVIGDIIKKGNCGRDKARNMIAELVKHGYAEREQQREEGKFGSSVLVIFDEPNTAEGTAIAGETGSVAFLPQTDLPATASPSPVSPSPGKPAHSNNSSLENTDNQNLREGASEDFEGEESGKALERRFRKWWATWPTYEADTEATTRRAWLALTAAQRKACEELTPRYIEVVVKKIGRSKVKAASTYLAERPWERLPGEAKAGAYAPKSTIAVAPFGPVWAAMTALSFLDGPIDVEVPDDVRANVVSVYEVYRRTSETRAFAYLQGLGIERDADGEMRFPEDFEAAEYRRRVTKMGYPEANRLYKLASNRERDTADASFAALSELCEPVPVGSDGYEEWKTYFSKRRWQFVPDPGTMRVVYFPKGGPSGLEDFERAARAVMSEGQGHDDAA